MINRTTARLSSPSFTARVSSPSFTSLPLLRRGDEDACGKVGEASKEAERWLGGIHCLSCFLCRRPLRCRGSPVVGWACDRRGRSLSGFAVSSAIAPRRCRIRRIHRGSGRSRASALFKGLCALQLPPRAWPGYVYVQVGFLVAVAFGSTKEDDLLGPFFLLRFTIFFRLLGFISFSIFWLWFDRGEDVESFSSNSRSDISLFFLLSYSVIIKKKNYASYFKREIFPFSQGSREQPRGSSRSNQPVYNFSCFNMRSRTNRLLKIIYSQTFWCNQKINGFLRLEIHSFVCHL